MCLGVRTYAEPLAISACISNKLSIKITDNIKIVVVFSKWLT